MAEACATWADVVAIVAAAFDVVIQGDGWLGLVHRERTDDELPPQKVKVVASSALGQPYVSIIADVFAHDVIDPAMTLEINHALVIGALEREDDRILLRATVPLVGLGEVYLRRIVLHVARQAEHMRRTGGAQGIRALPFGHYAE